RAEERLVGGSEDRALLAATALLLALAEDEPASDVQLPRPARQHLGVDQRGADLGEIPFSRLREGGHEQIGHGEREDGVAEELELLVVRRSRARRAVAQRELEMLDPREPMTEGRLEGRACIVHHAGRAAVARTPASPLTARRTGTRRPAQVSGPSRRARR